MRTRLGPVLTAADLPVAELASARLDGVLYRLGEAWCPIDEIDGPGTRAASLRPILPSAAIVERMSAAWVYGLVTEPVRHEFCVDVGARAHIPPSLRVHVREVTGAWDGVRRFNGVPVSSPLRTATDLARWTGSGADDPVDLIVALLRYGGYADVEPARRLCRLPRLPHRLIALARLAEAQSRLPRPSPNAQRPPPRETAVDALIPPAE